MTNSKRVVKTVKAWAVVNPPMNGVLMELKGHKSVFKTKQEAEEYIDGFVLTKDFRSLLFIVPCSVSYALPTKRKKINKVK